MKSRNMNHRNQEIWSLNSKGEVLNECLHDNNRKRFKPDTPFDNPVIPYIIMAFCAAVDGCVFYSLFSMLSYDSPLLLAMEIGGLLFGFDAVPIFVGIQYRRLKQNLTKDRFILILALVVCGLACALNIALRMMTIGLISPGTSTAATSYIGTAAEETADSGVDATSAALTIFGIVLPVVTSLGSCMISFMTYNPLAVRKKRTAEMIEDTKDQVRRFDAILGDYDAEPDFAEKLESEDEMRFKAMQKMHKALTIGYCDYVRERLKEYLGNPTSNNILSKDECGNLLAALGRDMKSLYATDDFIDVPEGEMSRKSLQIESGSPQEDPSIRTDTEEARRGLLSEIPEEGPVFETIAHTDQATA